MSSRKSRGWPNIAGIRESGRLNARARRCIAESASARKLSVETEYYCNEDKTDHSGGSSLRDGLFLADVEVLHCLPGLCPPL